MRVRGASAVLLLEPATLTLTLTGTTPSVNAISAILLIHHEAHKIEYCLYCRGVV